jgi:hypothetical protein
MVDSTSGALLGDSHWNYIGNLCSKVTVGPMWGWWYAERCYIWVWLYTLLTADWGRQHMRTKKQSCRMYFTIAASYSKVQLLYYTTETPSSSSTLLIFQHTSSYKKKSLPILVGDNIIIIIIKPFSMNQKCRTKLQHWLASHQTR